MKTDLYTRQKTDSKWANDLRNVLAAWVNLETQINSACLYCPSVIGIINREIECVKLLLNEERKKKSRRRNKKLS